MNYYTLRILMMILIFVLLILSDKFLIKKRLKSINRIKISTTFLFLVIIWVFPFDKFLMKFDTVEKAFNYYYPSGEIIRKYVYDDYAYILYFDSGPVKFAYYVKKDNEWGFDNQLKRGQGILKDYNGYTVFINEIKDKNIVALAIVYPNFVNESISISDSLLTDFDEFTYDNDKKDFSYAYVAIIDEKVDNNYILNIGGNEYKIFE